MASDMTELTLALPGNTKKRAALCISDDVADDESSTTADNGTCLKRNRVVGWPPVCSFRQKSIPKRYVKVSMDGAPFLRKIDLGSHNTYLDLLFGLNSLFQSFDFDPADVYPGPELARSSEFHYEWPHHSRYAVIYEDEDGDWLLLADVPWQVFITSCKKLRIMKIS